MDSSRSGLFSTLIMTVPLIVVPAIALLRPAIHTPGVSTNPLSASDDEDGDLFSGFEFDDLSHEGLAKRQQPGQKSADSSADNDYSDWFEVDEESESEKQPDTSDPSPNSAVRSPSDVLEDPFSRMPEANHPESAAPPPISSPQPKTAPERIPVDATNETAMLEQVIRLGATRTMWFSTGNSRQFGFVAFVAGKSSQISYRFESIGNSRAKAIHQVYEQIVQWQTQNQITSQ